MTDTDERIRQAKQRFGIIGNSPALIEAVGRAIRVAPIDLSVLITGESGSGKEFFPKIIHALSARKHARYIAVNCGAIPEGTIDSELFGHEKGSFTGAVASRKGYFEEADGGTIFLDEVAELPLTTQARLLRVLESGEFIRVGSSTVMRTNIRVVAATNVDMARAVAEGRFREDLYYRLSTVSITVPPLRDRGMDIILLARKFASDFAERYRTPAVTFDDSARDRLLTYRWPGNVRQLKNIIDQVSLFEAGTTVSATVLSRYLPPSEPMSLTVGRAAHGTSSRYDAERDMLLNLIFRLQSEIEDLRALVTPRAATVPVACTDVAASTDVSSARVQGNAGAEMPVAHTHGVSSALCHLRDDIPTLVPADRRPATDPDTTDVTPVDVSEEASATVPGTATDEDTERTRIISALRRHDGRRSAAAADLGISERTLYRKIDRLGISM